MKILQATSLIFVFMLVAGCSRSPTPSEIVRPTNVVPSRTTPTTRTKVPFPVVVEPDRYRRLPMPLIPRASTDQTSFLVDGIGLQTGSYRVEYAGDRFFIYPQNDQEALALTLPGGDALNMMGNDPEIESIETDAGERIILTGQSDWGADFQITFHIYPYHPGLIRWRMEIIRNEAPPAGAKPELQFVDRTTGEETKGQLEVYADRAPLAAPHLYAYSETLDSTLFYWVDLTALNPFMEAARYTPTATPRRMGQRFGHQFSKVDLMNQPQHSPVPLYDCFLYLMPSEPADEDEMFTRYLHNLSDIYDLITVPDDPLFGWLMPYEIPEGAMNLPPAIQDLTILDLANEENWVMVDGKRYLRAYVGDTRQSAEAITQLDVYSALTRYKLGFGDAPDYYHDLRATIPEFFNPDFGPEGMFQNSGPISLTGAQGRGDTWYELGHAIKVTELAIWDPEDRELRDLAMRSGDAWIDFAHTVDYDFPRFYSFNTWEGIEREPDAGGGYAYLMLLLHDLTGEDHYVNEARASLKKLEGYGFSLSYETHMTALTAAAAARLYQLDQDSMYLEIINRAVANLMRLSWIWECDYGWMGEDIGETTSKMVWGITSPRTFFGLTPTQRGAVITPKEQYEAWTYLIETLQRLHGVLDPDVEKLIAEFVKHTLLTIPWSLPPLLPDGAATEHPAAYESVAENDLSLFIPLEDLRDGWDLSGAIGQQIYGSGMAPAMAAQAVIEIVPGITLFSGYPLIKAEDLIITFAGVSGTFSPVVVVGVSEVQDFGGRTADSEACGNALCFQAEGGSTYYLVP
ncbi:MAG: hypothetical protein GTO18_00605 [Anaerolineales bacterium]|nr:hypothetical protein [Anaerolineales bacterium]